MANVTRINGEAPKRNLTHVANGDVTMCGLPVADVRAIDTTPTLRKMTCSWCRVAMLEDAARAENETK